MSDDTRPAIQAWLDGLQRYARTTTGRMERIGLPPVEWRVDSVEWVKFEDLMAAVQPPSAGLVPYVHHLSSCAVRSRPNYWGSYVCDCGLAVLLNGAAVPPPAEAPKRMTPEAQRLEAGVLLLESLQADGIFLHAADGHRLSAAEFQGAVCQAFNRLLAEARSHD